MCMKSLSGGTWSGCGWRLSLAGSRTWSELWVSPQFPGMQPCSLEMLGRPLLAAAAGRAQGKAGRVGCSWRMSQRKIGNCMGASEPSQEERE